MKISKFISAFTLALLSLSAQATEIILNGGFESNAGNGQLYTGSTRSGVYTAATGWRMANSTSYTFLFASGTADTTGANGQYGNLSLWGPNNGSANGLPASSPNGGYFIASDSAFQQSAIQQTVTGLTPGNRYTLSFWWAGAQQSGFSGNTYDRWVVTLGSETHATTMTNLTSHGFTGWIHESFTYTATSTTELLSFLADGGPTGVPPFALLDGVSMQQATVPEPTTYGLLSIGLLGWLLAYKRRANRA
jgi:hypothetical protein